MTGGTYHRTVFLMLPRWVFGIFNSGVYVLQIAILFALGRNKMPRSNLMLLAIFCGMWLLCPHYSAVNLWQDGAMNYLWSTVLALIFLQVFIQEYIYDKQIRTWFGKFCFLCLSFGMGAYSETASSAAIFMAMLIVLLMLLEQKKKIEEHLADSHRDCLYRLYNDLPLTRAVERKECGNDDPDTNREFPECFKDVLENVR